MTSCPLCRAHEFRPFIRERRWQYISCLNCGLVFLQPQPSTVFLHRHYQDYLPARPQGVVAWHRLMAQVFVRSAKLIEEHIPKAGRLLDVGCGYGFFLEEMRNRGWQVKGIEISATGRHYAQSVLGLEVLANPLPRPEWPKGRYDVVTLFYVIEHVPDPLAVLREVRRLLRPGGLVLLRWPHTAPIVRILRPWAAQLALYQAPSHLFDFSPPTMYKMLTQLGFREIRTTVCGWTRPVTKGARLAAVLFGGLGEILARASDDRLLLPGVSKTTLARR